MASNVELLTHSHNVIRAKKRQKLGQVKTVVFDEDARREFLTGFHKRKLAKKEESKKKAQARQKEERLEARQEHRRMLAEQAAQNAARVEEAYGGVAQRVESDEEWTGIASSPSSSGAGPDPEHEYEYSDEEQLATVTVVEDFDPSALLHGVPVPSSSEEQRPEERAPPLPRARAKVATRGHSSSADVGGGERPLAKNEGKTNKNGAAAKKVRYETKAARRATRATQRARKTEKAERAGGKAARKKTGGRRPRG
ncbi:nucleolar protein 12-domain-containing protein [Russula brevipes]|nr:nucleolar protein 12-domain-containing protein [Russula brevipes]